MIGTECHVVKGLIAIKFDSAPARRRAAVKKSIGGDRVSTAAEVNALLNPRGYRKKGEGGSGPLESELLTAYLQEVTLWAVEPGTEHEVAQRLNRLTGVTASPVHAMGRLNHLSKMPGTPPGKEFRPRNPPGLAAPSPGRIVAVVDSGVTDEIPEWLKSGIEVGGPEDNETLNGSTNPDASHGVFVAGLIRRIAPEHTIHMARTAPRPIGIFTDSNAAGHQPGEDPTTELDVALAITRLIHRLKGSECSVEALNLSLGGSSCSDDDPVMVVIEDAIDRWLAAFPDSVVFGAGGNRDDTQPILPGALPVVRAVAAAEDGGRNVVWEINGTVLDAPKRPWITDVAPGANLTSPSGRTADSWVHWSGSSFATAVATACYASRRPRQVVGGIVHWPNSTITYKDIPGLLID
jgi:Subtilase family